jgi:integrase
MVNYENLEELFSRVSLEKVKEANQLLKNLKIKRSVSRVIDTLTHDGLKLALKVNNELSTSEASKALNHILMLFAFYSFLRASEITQLELEDVDFANNRILVKEGKGTKDRYVGINQELKPHLVNYVKHIRPESKSSKVFLLPNGGEISLDRIEKRIKYIFNKAGLKGLMHAFRRGGITHFANKNVPLSHLQVVAGHKNIQTTMTYVNHRVEEVINAQINW